MSAFDVCSCMCHGNEAVKHFVACCVMCSRCGLRIKLYRNDQHDREHDKEDLKTAARLLREASDKGRTWDEGKQRFWEAEAAGFLSVHGRVDKGGR